MYHLPQLTQKLREIFQTDRADLDFGIYRILNSRSEQINDYLNRKLPQKVQRAFNAANQGQIEQWQKALDEAIKQAQDLGVNPQDSAKVQNLKAQIAQAKNSGANSEAAVFSHLYTFFSRYYEEGDFISQRRYKGDTYAIPYSGEEVLLHWANKDQYYTKSGENFSNYRFKLSDGREVFFRLITADTAKDNRKDNDNKRLFALAEPKTIEKQDEDGETYQEQIETLVQSEDGQTLEIHFEYRPADKKDKQDQENARTIAALKEQISDSWAAVWEKSPTDKNLDRTLLEKHLSDYTQKNTADYFIHKDLGGFLRRELDFYIKNEVMHLDNIQHADSFAQIENSLRQIQVLREIAHDIITFLAQLEDFQKKLWLKKKFVAQTHYLITLDKIPAEMLPETLANPAQQVQWKNLFNINVLEQAGGGNLDEQNLKKFQQNQPHLVVDTSLYPPRYQQKLLTLLTEAVDLDANTDGVLIHSDNFQALNLLQARYREQVKCIYIDPPYNTGTDGFIYKDNYQHSSWLTIIDNRTRLAKKLLSKDAALFCQISDIENSNLNKLMCSIFGEKNHRETISVITSSKSGVNAINVKRGEHLFKIKEYIQFYSNSPEFRFKYFYTPDKYNNNYKWEIYKDIGGTWRVCDLKKEKNLSDQELEKYALDNPKNIFSIEKNNSKAGEGIKAVLEKSKYSGEVETFIDKNGNEKILYQGGVCVPLLERVVIENGKKYFGVLGSDIWDDIGQASGSEGNVSFGNGKKPEKLLKRIIEMTTNENDLVLDFFLGSGTTSCVAQKLKRKWIGIEQGDYFNNVTLQRIMKTLSGDQTGISKSTNYKGGGIVKVLKLESYEDTLNNLQLKAQSDLFKMLPEAVQEDYLLRYLLDTESKGSLLNSDDFQHPFDYRLNIATDSAGAYQSTVIDLPETFNYLLGIRVQQITDEREKRGYLTIEGLLPNDARCLIVWRDCEKMGYAEVAQFFDKHNINPNSNQYDVIYLNGDHDMASLWQNEDGSESQLKLRAIEPEFLNRMFTEKGE
ncbi:site-specific DNA-methyltransferase [Gallibacterium anatis]|uniref:site-specific DNA-methyltransferase n=1 Tax=Gallibacterium anatis TaxID=750 RepID=UPI0039FCC213